MPNFSLPLEKTLKDIADTQKSEFAHQHVNYGIRYAALAEQLKNDVYPYINAGLACMSKSPGLYTDHGERHFDEVIRYAGLLLENSPINSDHGIKPYELYLLLCAIRVHDAGNIDGREDHEKTAAAVLARYGGEISRDGNELGLIADIAQAHGGRLPDKSKDTIGVLPAQIDAGATAVRPQLIAAIVRFADEICEHSSRAVAHHIAAGTVPDENKLFQFYARSVAAAKPDKPNKAFRIRYRINVECLREQYPTPRDENGNIRNKYFIDDVWDRIDKLNHERIYCNRFLLPSLQTDRIEVSMEFFEHEIMSGISLEKRYKGFRFTIEDDGYPNVPSNWKKQLAEYAGEILVSKTWE